MNGPNENSVDNAPFNPFSGLARVWPLLLLAVITLFVYLMGWHHYLSFTHFIANQDVLADVVVNHFAVTAAVYFFLYALVVALSLPVASFLTLLGGFLFGGLFGGLLTVVAATLGALAVFLIARTSLGNSLAARAGPWLGRLREGFRDHALNYLLFLRLVPLFPFWLVNIAPALLGVGIPIYLFGTLIGIIPATFAFSFIGAGLGSLIEAQSEAYESCLAANSQHVGQTACHVSLSPSDLMSPELLIGLAALGVVALIPVAVKKLRKS